MGTVEVFFGDGADADAQFEQLHNLFFVGIELGFLDGAQRLAQLHAAGLTSGKGFFGAAAD